MVIQLIIVKQKFNQVMTCLELFPMKQRNLSLISCHAGSLIQMNTTHAIIDENLHRAPMFSGMVKGTGARYCPSIEDKVVRFSDKPRHQIFLEPEGRNTDEVYVQGLSTSMPEDVQQRILKTIPGLENVQMMRAGYAIEYDAIEPSQLWPTLETKSD